MKIVDVTLQVRGAAVLQEATHTTKQSSNMYHEVFWRWS